MIKMLRGYMLTCTGKKAIFLMQIIGIVRPAKQDPLLLYRMNGKHWLNHFLE
jgi:hypothetical protein